jgi:hypothetical protein
VEEPDDERSERQGKQILFVPVRLNAHELRFRIGRVIEPRHVAAELGKAVETMRVGRQLAAEMAGEPNL